MTYSGCMSDDIINKVARRLDPSHPWEPVIVRERANCEKRAKCEKEHIARKSGEEIKMVCG